MHGKAAQSALDFLMCCVVSWWACRALGRADSSGHLDTTTGQANVRLAATFNNTRHAFFCAETAGLCCGASEGVKQRKLAPGSSVCDSDDEGHDGSGASVQVAEVRVMAGLRAAHASTTERWVCQPLVGGHVQVACVVSGRLLRPCVAVLRW